MSEPEPETVRSTRFQDPEGRLLYFNIIGPSMRPLLRSGDVLEAEPYRGTRIRVGDIVVFSPPKETRFITHRLVLFRNGCYIARGDNNTRADPWPLTADDIVGKVLRVRRKAWSRRLASGASGRLIGSGLRGLNSAWLQLFRLIRPLYRWVEKLGAFRWLAGPLGGLKTVLIVRPAGPELYLLLGRRSVGKLGPGQQRWWIRPPYRLVIDEKQLPRPE